MILQILTAIRYLSNHDDIVDDIADPNSDEVSAKFSNRVVEQIQYAKANVIVKTPFGILIPCTLQTL